MPNFSAKTKELLLEVERLLYVIDGLDKYIRDFKDSPALKYFEGYRDIKVKELEECYEIFMEAKKRDIIYDE